jgi:uncharacterized protein (TIGR03083 family)
MPKPRDKQALFDAIDAERRKLLKALEGLTDDEMETPGACEAWSVKDILAHLIDWEGRVVRWYQAGERGEVPKTPDENYNWRELPALNQAIYAAHQHRSLAEVRKAFADSFDEIRTVLEGIPEEALFTKHVYAWTKNSLLGDYFNSCTAAHYRWASALIRKFTRQRQSE